MFKKSASKWLPLATTTIPGQPPGLSMWRILLLYANLMLLLLILSLPIAAARAEGIWIKSVNLAAVGDGYEISVDSEIVLNATLEQALEKGIVLYFVTKFSLVDSRWYWLDEEVARGKLRVGLRYYALTRQYHLNHPPFSRSFYTLKEALQVLGQMRDYPLTVKSELKQDADYIASLRVWLDLTRMPKPFQVEALGSSQWNLSSDKLEWRMKLPVPELPLHIKAH
jgi:phage gp46-like protein